MALNIKKSSLQRIYEYALKHVRKQGKPGVDGGSCAYETSDGLKCAVGAMLTDEQRAAAMACGVGSVRADSAFFLPIVGADRTGKKMSLLDALQQAHDTAARDNGTDGDAFLPVFEEYMQKVAEKFGLKYAPPGKTLRA